MRAATSQSESPTSNRDALGTRVVATVLRNGTEQRLGHGVQEARDRVRWRELDPGDDHRAEDDQRVAVEE